MCWEDPDIVVSALEITTEDTVLSVASGGENIFALLLRNPKRLVAIDSNIAQIYLVQLKAAAIKELSYEKFVKFIGFKESSDRIYHYNICKKHLTADATQFWDNNIPLIKQGIINSGKFESYLLLFRKYVLRFVLSGRSLEKFLGLQDIGSQKDFFNKKWNNLRWKLLFKIFFSRGLMQMFGRDKSYFRYTPTKNIAKHFYERSEYGITRIPIKSNYFMYMILIGKIPIPFENHPYLDKTNFSMLKKRVDDVEYVNQGVLEYFEQQDNNLFSKFNLSDVFEKDSKDQFVRSINCMQRTAKQGAIVCYWNNLVERKQHTEDNEFKPDIELSKELYRRNRVFFYSDFIVERRN